MNNAWKKCQTLMVVLKSIIKLLQNGTTPGNQLAKISNYTRLGKALHEPSVCVLKI